MTHVLIVGFGKIGRIHAKYLDVLKINWNWYDPFNNSKCKKKVDSIKYLDKFTHIIISTPTNTHDSILKDITNRFNNKILVEKPGVMSFDNLYLLNNNNVSVGLVERFNPSIITLLENINLKEILSIDFVRCSALPVSRIDVNSYVDVGIHDIDILTQIDKNINIINYNVSRNSNTFAINMVFNENKICRFLWSNETFYKDRKIIVRQKKCNFECNLIDQTLKKFYITENNKNIVEDLYVEKKSPILAQLEYFLFNNNNINSNSSHEIFIKLINENKDLRL